MVVVTPKRTNYIVNTVNNMKKILIGVSTILAMSSCTKEELIPTEHNAHVKVSTHNQTRMIAYVVNIATIPNINSIDCNYSFYAKLYDGTSVCCNVNSDTFDTRVSVDITQVEFIDLVEGFYVSSNNVEYKLDVIEIY